MSSAASFGRLPVSGGSPSLASRRAARRWAATLRAEPAKWSIFVDGRLSPVASAKPFSNSSGAPSFSSLSSALSPASIRLTMSRHSSDDFFAPEPKGQQTFVDHVDTIEQRNARSTGFKGLIKDTRMLGIATMATLGGFLFGYDQGVVGNVLVLESFGADFPHIYMNASVKGWWVSTLLLAAWLGSLLSGPLTDRLGRKRTIQWVTIIFVLGAALQAGATNNGFLFGGRAVAGLAVGTLTMVVPPYIAELAPAHLRGSLVALQQLNITVGILLSYWIAYGTSHIGGTRCAPGVPYTGPVGADGNPTFDAYHDVPAGGCTGQSPASWRIPIALQILPAILLGIGMFWMPYSPRWLTEVGRDEEAKNTLAYLRSSTVEDPAVVHEFLEIKAEVLIERELRHAKTAGKGGIRGMIQPYLDLVSTRSNFHRLWIGCSTMFFQQFIGCNAIIYYAPTIFASLGLDPNTTSLLATGVYGVCNMVSTLPAVLLLDRLGRRKLLLAGSVGCFCSLVIVGSIVATCANDWAAHASAGRVAIVFVYLYDVNFSYSWGPLGWVLPAEIFNLATRSTGTSLTTSTTWMSNFVIGLVSPMMLQNIAHGGTYFFFAAFAVIGFISTYLFLPETRMKTLEEMDELFGMQRAQEYRDLERRIRAEVGLGKAGYAKNESKEQIV
ncbi:Sugar transporter-domain containing protein [Rhodotorula toruloides]|uniref:Sugar (And other) transporter-domain containing protein n=1 Tax=Rhodotorula toruloides TaxID=5286 RepID=A0A2T0A0S6_RHOTO|nr:Sugar transporter-domain containing protein [Rhodotorula toruloides]PRQ71628.1 Sugar (and other) transporter-domain containing protein [Rhodotorula toruloides]